MIEEIKEKSKQELLAIPKSVFQKYFENWKNRWHKRIISEGRGFTLKGNFYVGFRHETCGSEDCSKIAKF